MRGIERNEGMSITAADFYSQGYLTIRSFYLNGTFLDACTLP